MNNETSSSSFLGITPSGLDQKYWQQLGPSNSVGIIPTGPEGLNSNGIGSQSKALSRSYRSSDTLRYFKMIESLAPHELLLKFAKSAPANIQEAAKSTVLNILGSMPNYALDAVLITTNKKLANLLYQMQITGYMFKNAEYRMSLTRMLKGLPKLPSATVISQGNISFNPLQSKISGEIEVMTSTGEKVSLNVEDLTSALSKEVEDLRSELALIRNQRENELKSNMLTYIQALPEKDLVRLTSDMSEDVVQAIQLLVDTVMERLGIDVSGPEVVLQQSVGHLAQLCMWQMVVGYKLREIEALEKGASLD
eukprot:gene25056-32668_t